MFEGSYYLLVLHSILCKLVFVLLIVGRQSRRKECRISLTVELHFNFSDRKFRLVVVIVVAARKTKSSVLFAIVRVLVRYTARFDSARNLTRYNRRQNDKILSPSIGVLFVRLHRTSFSISCRQVWIPSL